MLRESASFTQTVNGIATFKEGILVNGYRSKDRNVIPAYDPSQKGLLAVDFDDTVFATHYRLMRAKVFELNSNPVVPQICARNYQLCSKSTEGYNQALWPLLDLEYYKRWGLTYQMVMDIAANTPLKSGVVDLFKDIQSTKRVELAVISYGMKPFIEKVLESNGIEGVHVMANPVVDEQKGQMGINLMREDFDPYDITQWPSEPITAEANQYINAYQVMPATKGRILRGLENDLGINPQNTVVAYDSGGDINMARACGGLRIAQVNDRVHFLAEPRLQAILKSTDLVSIQPDGGFDYAAQAIRERMSI